MLIIDDTGFIKKGTTSAGVSRQYTGTSGKIDNCQIGVFAAYATVRGRALVDRGQDWSFRRLLEQLDVGYVVAVPKSQQIKSLAGIWRIDQLIGEAPDDAWQRLSCGDGAKGPRIYDWAAAKLPANIILAPDPPTHHRWVMARRSLSDPSELAYCLAYAPAGVETRTGSRCRLTLGHRGVLPGREEPVRPGRMRSPTLRGLVWPHHPGHARPRLPRCPRSPGPGHRKGGGRNDTTSLIPLTVAEIRRLLDTLLPHPRPHQDRRLHTLNWSHWRRHHQAIAQRCHYRRRASPGHDF